MNNKQKLASFNVNKAVTATTEATINNKNVVIRKDDESPILGKTKHGSGKK